MGSRALSGEASSPIWPEGCSLPASGGEEQPWGRGQTAAFQCSLFPPPQAQDFRHITSHLWVCPSSKHLENNCALFMGLL